MSLLREGQEKCVNIAYVCTVNLFDDITEKSSSLYEKINENIKAVPRREK